MLIRSQDKDELLNFDRVSGLNIYEAGDRFGIAAESLNYSETIGTYSSEKKAIKVLDMIQEAYAQCEITKASLSDIAKMVGEAPDTPEAKAAIEFAAKRIIEDMMFQMPEDDEVEINE